MPRKAKPKPRGPRGQGTVFPDGKGWRASLTLGKRDGKRVVARVRSTTEDGARAELETLRRAYASGSEPARGTLDDWLTGWLHDHGPDIRPSTLVSYKGHVRLHISPLLGGIRLARLQPADIRRLKADRLQAGLSPATVARIMTTLRIALNVAFHDRVIVDNPAVGVQLPRIEREPVEPLTEERAAAIVKAVKGSPIEALVVLLLGSGMRLGEAVGLDWRDVDLNQGYVVVRRTKTQVRAVPISSDAVTALRKHRKASPRVGPVEPVFLSPRRSRKTRQVERIRGDSVTHMLPRLLEAAEQEPLTPHALRHGVATLLVARGVHMRVVAEQLGHRNPALTARTYAHVVPQQQRDAVSKLDRREKGA